MSFAEPGFLLVLLLIPLATQHYPMLARNLLYTGVTRGKQLVVLIGLPKACTLDVRTVRAMRRLTNLAARLRQGEKGVPVQAASGPR